MALHRTWREGRYNQLCDAVYARRGWTNNAIPTLETLKKFKIDFPEVVAVVTPHLQWSEGRDGLVAMRVRVSSRVVCGLTDDHSQRRRRWSGATG